MMIPPFAIKAIAALVLLASVAGYGYHHGAQRIQAKWDKAAREAKDAAEAEREANRLRSQAAAADYETKRAALQRRAAQLSQEAVNALHQPICPEPGVPGRPLELGDVPVPAAVLDRLRSAGADF